MTKKYGWEILLGFVAVITIFKIFGPLIEKVTQEYGEVIAFLVVILIVWLLFKKYKIKQAKAL